MTPFARRLGGAALAFTLLALAASAAPGGGVPWWQELWEVLTGFRPAAFLGLGGPDKAGPAYDPGGTSSPDKSGPDYDPLGTPSPPPPSSLPGNPSPDKEGPAADPFGSPSPPPPSNLTGGGS